MTSLSEKPTEEEVRTLLAKVTEMRMQVTAAEASWDRMREELIPDEVKQKIEELGQEMAPKIAEMAEELDRVEKELRDMVARYGQTVTGLKFQVVYFSPKPVWNEKALEGYAAAHPDINALKTMSEAKAQIRAVTKK